MRMAMCWRLGSRMSIEMRDLSSMTWPRVFRHLEMFATGSAAPRRRVTFRAAPFGSRAVLGPKKVTKRRAPETSAPRLAARVGEPARLGADVAGRSRTPRCARPSPPTPLPHAGEGSFCCGFLLFGPLRKRRVGCRAQRGARQDVEQASSGQGCPVDASPEHGAPAGDRSRSERRGRWGVLSLGHVSLDKQRKVPRGRKAAKPAAKLTTGTPEPRHLLGTSKIDTPRNKA